MHNRFPVLSGIILFLSQIITISIYSAPNGGIEGTIRDFQSRIPLPYSSIILLNTSLGTSADVYGNYAFSNIPSGKYTLRISYIGYKQEEITVEIKDGQVINQDFYLTAEGISGKTVTITAQTEGQLAAINEQLSSIPVKNVVSSDRIKELPDANAAESVSRLPGVSLIRTGGEGSQVVIRGLSPQYNQITIDGVEMPGNVASENNIVSTDKTRQELTSNILGDRGSDLSMISSSMLGGIEVIKAITPDMDAALIGGVVNFAMRKAGHNTASLKKLGEPLIPLIEITTQGSYNNLKNTYNNYRFVASMEERFFDESFGVFIQGSAEKRNLSANELGANYDLKDKSHGDAGIPELTSMNLSDIFRERERQGVNAVLDYQYQSGEIGLMNFFSTSKTNATNRSEEINQEPKVHIYFSATDTRNKLNVISNLFSLKQDIPIFHIDLKLSHSYSESTNPEDLYFNFYQGDAGLDGNLPKVPPAVLASLVKPDPENTEMDVIQTSESFLKERTYTGSLGLLNEISLSDLFTVIIKFGGSYQYRKRSYDFNQYSGSHRFSGGDAVVKRMLEAFPQLKSQGGRLNVLAFEDDYDYGNFFNGEYSLPYPSINADLMRQIIPYIKGVTKTEGYHANEVGSLFNDYYGNEKKSAAYIMATVNIGNEITIVPGVRYQDLSTTYTAARGEVVPGVFEVGDTTISQTHNFFLPMLHIKYKVLDWLQLHFAYTNTLNYPDYSTITPRYFIGEDFVDYNNVQLKPARSENFDMVLSVYSNEVGLFTINGFLKQIKDLIFFSKTYITDLSLYPDLPLRKKQSYEFNTYINNPKTIDVYGMEADWQTHLWYLPSPFSGLVFNINYTHIFSEASYPRSVINAYDEQGNYDPVIIDTFYTTRLLNQPNDIVNLAVGYDYSGFSARLSLLYQDNIFKKPDFWMQNRINSDKYMRWDLSLKQTLPWFGIQLFFSLNNVTGSNDLDINQKNNFPASEQHYGMTMDLGLLLRL